MARGGEGWTAEDERQFHENRAQWNAVPFKTALLPAMRGAKLELRRSAEPDVARAIAHVRVAVFEVGVVSVALTDEDGHGIILKVTLPGVRPPTPESIVTAPVASVESGAVVAEVSP